MARMTKAQARKRLQEAMQKVKLATLGGWVSFAQGAKLIHSIETEVKRLDRK